MSSPTVTSAISVVCRPLAVSNTDVNIRITEPGFFNQPDYYDVLARLRAEAPVFNSEPNTWLVTRYDDIRAISRDTAHFTSQRGVLINDPARTAARPRVRSCTWTRPSTPSTAAS